MTRTIPVDQAVPTASTAAPIPKAKAIHVAAAWSKAENEGQHDQGRRERVVEHPVDYRRDDSAAHEVVEPRHSRTSCVEGRDPV